MGCSFWKIGKCSICGKEKRNFFLDRFKFLTADGDEITGVYCWRCSFRYDRYNLLLPGRSLILGSKEKQDLGGV